MIEAQCPCLEYLHPCQEGYPTTSLITFPYSSPFSVNSSTGPQDFKAHFLHPYPLSVPPSEAGDSLSLRALSATHFCHSSASEPSTSSCLPLPPLPAKFQVHEVSHAPRHASKRGRLNVVSPLPHSCVIIAQSLLCNIFLALDYPWAIHLLKNMTFERRGVLLSFEFPVSSKEP